MGGVLERAKFLARPPVDGSLENVGHGIFRKESIPIQTLVINWKPALLVNHPQFAFRPPRYKWRVQRRCETTLRLNAPDPPAAAALRAPIAGPEFAEAAGCAAIGAVQGDAAEDTAEIQRAATAPWKTSLANLIGSISVLFQQAHSSPAPWAARCYVRH